MNDNIPPVIRFIQCLHCGQPTAEGIEWCPKCGAKIESIPEQEIEVNGRTELIQIFLPVILIFIVPCATYGGCLAIYSQNRTVPPTNSLDPLGLFGPSLAISGASVVIGLSLVFNLPAKRKK